MAGGAGGRGGVGLMATDAAAHCRYARILGHRIELAHVAMTHGALHSGLQMRAVRPGYTGRHLVDAHPGNGLIGFCEVGELHNRRPVFGYSRVAHHAGARSWEGHLIAGIGIGVAGLASQPLCNVQLVAERNGLHGSGMGRKIIPHLLLGGLRPLRRLLGLHCEASQDENRTYAQPAGNSGAAKHFFCPLCSLPRGSCLNRSAKPLQHCVPASR
jgi:hypothetical protein